MNLAVQMLRAGLRIIIAYQSIGKKNEYIYEAGGLRFYVRNKTADRFVIGEIFNDNPFALGESSSDNNYDIHVPDDAVIVDIGANIGVFTVWAGIKAPKGRIFAYEPELNTFNQLNKNVRLNDLNNVVAYRLGVAGKPGSLTLFVDPRNQEQASLYESLPGKEQVIECITLDDILRINQLDRIDILKVDTEGAEYEILSAASAEVLSKIKCIVLEYHDYLDKKFDYRNLVKLLEQQGFRVEEKTTWLFRTFIRSGILVGTR